MSEQEEVREVESTDEIVESLGGSGEIRPYMELARKLVNIAKLTQADAGIEISQAVVDRIALAMSPEEIFAANESGPGDMDEYLSMPIELFEEPRVSIADPKYRRGTLGVYLTMKFHTQDKEEHLVTVGAVNVVASWWRLWELEMFGTGGKTFWNEVRSQPTPNGNLYTVHATPTA
jgi:hypothetical protein